MPGDEKNMLSVSYVSLPPPPPFPTPDETLANVEDSPVPGHSVCGSEDLCVWGSENTTLSACRGPRINVLLSGAPPERAGEARSFSSVPQQYVYTALFSSSQKVSAGTTCRGPRFHCCSAMLCKAVRGRLCLCSETPAFTKASSFRGFGVEGFGSFCCSGLQGSRACCFEINSPN